MLDANILYPAPIRDIMLQLAFQGMFRARWTDDIHREWIEALLKKQPYRQREKLERTRHLMDVSTPDALITGYESLIACLELPDPDDRHVLAAAIVGRCDVIVTQNLQHFPQSVLQIYDIEAQHPDDFLVAHFNHETKNFCEAIREVRARLKNPTYTVKQYIDNLKKQGLVTTAKELELHSELL
ncbi:MAG: hypothetical protein Kow00117_18640 [Phototrophicales bacterium]